MKYIIESLQWKLTRAPLAFNPALVAPLRKLLSINDNQHYD